MSKEELYVKYQSLFSEEMIEVQSPVSESIQLLQPKKMCGPITEEEFDEMFKEFL
jgi:hypothetical protein